MNFYGRENEISLLKDKNRLDKAQLTAIYGRRRIGKTSLVEYTFKNDKLWKFEGIENGSRQIQLKYFLKQLSHYSKDLNQNIIPKDWGDVFDILEEQINQYRKKDKTRLIIFFDEFQWMAEMKPGLVSIFKYYWDNFFSKHEWCDFIICGSVSSFIVGKVIQSKALYGRIGLEINLPPLSLKECKKFYKKGPFVKHALENYMVLGGVPQYYQEFNSTLSLQQNLDKLAFSPYGYLFKEFDRLFISHFSTHNIYEKILQILSVKKYSYSELAKKCGIAAGGSFSERMKELEQAGFVKSSVPIDKKSNSRLIQYAINDEYLHFYFSFILPFSEEILSGNINFQKIASHKNYEQWQGYAFERLCQKHSKLIADFLKFSAVKYRSGSWFRRSQGRNTGIQIDLMYVRGDKVLTVCEIKYSKKLLPSAIMSNFKRKIDVLSAEYENFAIEKVLIVGNVQHIPQALENYFDNIITAEKLFDL